MTREQTHAPLLAAVCPSPFTKEVNVSTKHFLKRQTKRPDNGPLNLTIYFIQYKKEKKHTTDSSDIVFKTIPKRQGLTNNIQLFLLGFF